MRLLRRKFYFQGKLDYDHWLAEPGILARVLQVESFKFYFIFPIQLAISGLHVQLHINGHGGGAGLQGLNVFPLHFLLKVIQVEKIEDQMELFLEYARNFGVPQVLTLTKYLSFNKVSLILGVSL